MNTLYDYKTRNKTENCKFPTFAIGAEILILFACLLRPGGPGGEENEGDGPEDRSGRADHEPDPPGPNPPGVALVDAGVWGG